MQINKRRRGEELYLPMAISLEELRDTISSRLPDKTAIISTETLRQTVISTQPKNLHLNTQDDLMSNLKESIIKMRGMLQ